MKFRIFLALALLGCALSASAQFTGGTSKRGNVTNPKVVDIKPYNRVSLSYDNTHLGCNDKIGDYFNGEDAMSLNGFGVEYVHGFSVSKTLPMYVEAGVKLQMGFGSVSYEYDDEDNDEEEILKAQFMSFSVPVNYTYKFSIGDKMAIAPYLGVNFKIHALGRTKYEVKFDDDEMQDYWDEDYVNDDWYNVFDKKDMGGKDYTWNRFQMGWQIGAGFSYKAFYVGLQYGTDFIPAFKYKKEVINSGTFSAKIGMNF